MKRNEKSTTVVIATAPMQLLGTRSDVLVQMEQVMLRGDRFFHTYAVGATGHLYPFSIETTALKGVIVMGDRSLEVHDEEDDKDVDHEARELLGVNVVLPGASA
jgi:hypothetical protein